MHIRSSQRPMYVFLIVLAVFAALGLQGWRTLFNNFAVEVVGITGRQMGIIQSLRELPGFLALVVVYILLFVSEHRLAAISVLIMALGVSLTGFLPSYQGLILTTLLMSFGFHYYETVNQSLTLQYFDTMQAPVVLGRLRAASSLANIGAGIMIWSAALFLEYRAMFLMIGITSALAGAWALTRNPADKNLPLQHKNMVFRKKYWLFYVLTFLAGARRQIFMAFAVFLLVKKFSFSVQEITLLFVLNNLINTRLSPAIGRAVNRFGERKVLTLEYTALIFVFLVYALTDSKAVAALMYILDHVFFNFAIAIRSYFQKVAHHQDIAPSMAVGFTINHIVAVIIPALGGFLWMIDYRIPFFIGVGLSLCSLFFVQLIRIPESC